MPHSVDVSGQKKTTGHTLIGVKMCLKRIGGHGSKVEIQIVSVSKA